MDGENVLKIARNDFKNQTEVGVIQQIGSLIKGAMQLTVDKPESP